MKISKIIRKLLSSPNVSSRQPIFEKYDQNVQGNTIAEREKYAANVIAPFRDFSELPQEKSRTMVAIATGGNPNFAKISAKKAAIFAVIEGIVKITCVGARAVAATNCLNFGNPEKHDQMGECVSAIDGLADVCRAVKIPIVSGNVSFYNESSARSIPPSALVSIFGKIDKNHDLPPSFFTNKNSKIVWIGSRSGNLGGSEFLRIVGKRDSRLPTIDFADFEKWIKNFRENIKFFDSATPVLTGGKIATIAIGCFEKNFGAKIKIPSHVCVPNFLFSENPGIIATTEDSESVRGVFGENFLEIGEVSSDGNLEIEFDGDKIAVEKISELKKIWQIGMRGIF